ncbi:glycosyltransferase family 39 protein [Patescibacteria group bacterium]|nr:glycosyltransferase family 39 protein [Patescibacteria group bacterium]
MFKKKHYFFIIVLILAAFVRFWNIPNTVQFLGDQGRDSLIVSKIFKENNFVFIGPVTSVGNMYLGPLYYYFMVPFLMISYPNPLGPVYAVAFLGVLTIYLMYALGKELVGQKVALVAATLMTLSATVVAGTRFSWNPNPAPLISLLLIYFVFKALRKDTKYWILVVLCFSVLIQLHYLTLLAGLGFGSLWVWQLYQKHKNKKSIRKMMISTIIGVFIFVSFLTPLVLFDLKHDGLNFQAFKKIIIGENSFEEESFAFLDRGSQILVELSIGDQKNLNNYLFIFFIGILILSLSLRDSHRLGKIIIVTFLITGIFGTALYKHTIFDHYVAYLFPVSFFALGIIGEYLYKKGVSGKLAISLFLILFVNYNVIKMTKVLSSTGSTMNKIWSSSKTISDRVADGEKYNIVLLTGTGDIDGQNYRYFLSTTNKPPVEMEDRGQIDTLFIINDDKVLKNVVDSPIYEIVVFPNKIASEVYQINDGPEITVLRRN